MYQFSGSSFSDLVLQESSFILNLYSVSQRELLSSQEQWFNVVTLLFNTHSNLKSKSPDCLCSLCLPVLETSLEVRLKLQLSFPPELFNSFVWYDQKARECHMVDIKQLPRVPSLLGYCQKLASSRKDGSCLSGV